MSDLAQPQPEDAAAAAPRSAPEPNTPGPRRGRWKRRIGIALLFVAVLLAVLVGFAPAIASIPAVHKRAVAHVNQKIQGELAVDGLALSWGGPIEIRGLVVRDPAQQQLVRAERVTADVGVWRLITDPLNFGEVSVESPAVLIEQRRDGQITLARAFQPRPSTSPAAESAGPPPAEPAAPLPEPRGRLVIKGGRVKVVREGAGSYEVANVNGQADLKTLNDIAGQIDLTLPDGSRLAGETTLRQLVVEGKLDPRNATGVLRLATDGQLQIGPLAALAGQPDLVGQLGLDVHSTIDAGKLQGRLALGVSGLQSAARAAAGATPITAELDGQVAWADDQLAADMTLSGEAGQARFELAYRHSDRPLELSAAQLVSALLSEQPLALPEVTVDGHASIDLARLGRAAPELLKVRQGVELTGGKLEIPKLTVRGGATPLAAAELVLKDLAARRDGQPVRLEPIAFNLDSALEPGQGLRVRQLALQSTFAQISASGLARDLRTTFKASLSELQRELSQVFELGTMELAGELDGTLELKRVADEQVDVRLQASAAKFRYADGGRTIDLPRAGIRHTGQLQLAEQKLARVIAQETRVDLNGEVVASATGWFDVQQQGLKADLALERGELAFVAGRATDLGLPGLARYSGGLRLRVSVEQAAAAQPVLSKGELVVQHLGVDGRPVVDGDAIVRWDGVQLAANGRSLQVATAQLESTLAQLTARDVRWIPGDRPTLEGRLEGGADVAGCLKAAGPLAGWQEPPNLAGRLTVSAAGGSTGNQLNLKAQGAIEQFVIGAGQSAIREERVQFAADAQVDQARQSVSITKVSLASKPLSAEIAGTIQKYTQQCKLDLRGNYSASWEAITALLHELVPSTADTVILAGASKSEFTITGPARDPGAQPAFRGLRSGAQLAWQSAELYGVKLGPAALAPVLKNGQVTLPKTEIPAGDGKVTLRAVVDFQPADPTLTITGKLALLNNVPVTKELGAQLLSRINPVFLHVADIEGRVQLTVQDVLVPLGPSVRQQGAGQGRLDLRKVKMQPGGLLGELLMLGDLKGDKAYPVEIGAVDFVMRDGRIVYDRFALKFPGEFELIFRGSVGLDDTLDLVVSVPVRAGLLARLGAKGASREYAEKLGGMRVDIPIVGTREKPGLDFSQVDVQSLLKDSLLDEPGKQLEGLLRGLQGDRKQR